MIHTMETNREFPPTGYRAVSPGEIMREELKERKITQKDFAKQINEDEALFKSFIRGVAPVTKELAKKFEKALGIDSRTWLNYERAYRHDLEVIAERKALAGVKAKGTKSKKK